MSNSINEILLNDSLTLMSEEAKMRELMSYDSNVLPMSTSMEKALRKMCHYTHRDVMSMSNERLVKLMKEYKEQYGVLPTEWEDYIRKCKYAVALADVYDMTDLEGLSLTALRDLYENECMGEDRVEVVRTSFSGAVKVVRKAA